jgi:carboxypeptidase C (cathepsin A)
MCNYIGNERWVNELETDFKEEFQSSTALPWVTIKDNKVAGEVRVAGGDGSTAGNVTFVTIFEAGCVISPARMVDGVDSVLGTWCRSTSRRPLSYVQRLA